MASITDLNVSLNDNEEKNLQGQGFKKIPGDLNKGTGGNQIYLWYKKKNGAPPITRLQMSFTDDMTPGLSNAGYSKIDKNLNTGPRGDQLYLWLFRGKGEYDTPITEISVTTEEEDEPSKLSFGWERLGCETNRGTPGAWVHIWMKREKTTYICNVTATDDFGSDSDLFSNGYIRLDEDTTRGAGERYVFLWYRQTADPKKALTDLQVSNNRSDYQEFQQQNYKQVKTDLNQGTGGVQVYMWIKQDEVYNPIKDLLLLQNPDAFKAYQVEGNNVMMKNLNSGNKGRVQYLCIHR